MIDSVRECESYLLSAQARLNIVDAYAHHYLLID